MSKISINDLFLYTKYTPTLSINDVIEVSVYNGTEYISNTMTLTTLKETFTNTYYNANHNLLDIFFKPSFITDNTSTQWPLFVYNPESPNWIWDGAPMNENPSDNKTWSLLSALKDSRKFAVDTILTDSDYINTKYWAEVITYGFTGRFIINPNTGRVAAPILNSSYIRNTINSPIGVTTGTIQTSLVKSHKHYIKTVVKNSTTGSTYPSNLTTTSSATKTIISSPSGSGSSVIPPTSYMVPYIQCAISPTIPDNKVNKSYIQNVINKANSLPIGSIISVPKIMIASLIPDENGDIFFDSGWKVLNKLNDISIDKFYIKGFAGTDTYGKFTNPFGSGFSMSPIYGALNHYHGFAHLANSGAIYKCMKPWKFISDYTYYSLYYGKGTATGYSNVSYGSMGTTDMIVNDMTSTIPYTPNSYNVVFLVKT